MPLGALVLDLLTRPAFLAYGDDTTIRVETIIPRWPGHRKLPLANAA